MSSNVKIGTGTKSSQSVFVSLKGSWVQRAWKTDKLFMSSNFFADQVHEGSPSRTNSQIYFAFISLPSRIVNGLQKLPELAIRDATKKIASCS